METLHKLAECSKGTLYKHFINREDLLCEIATRYSISIILEISVGCEKDVHRQYPMHSLCAEFRTSTAVSRITSYFKRMKSFKGNTREQIMVLFLAYQTFCFSNPALFACVLQLQNQSLMKRG